MKEDLVYEHVLKALGSQPRPETDAEIPSKPAATDSCRMILRKFSVFCGAPWFRVERYVNPRAPELSYGRSSPKVYLELVDHLLEVFASHRWGHDTPEELEYQLADRKIKWQEASVVSVSKTEQPRLLSCADQAQSLILRRGQDIPAADLREALEALWLHPEPPKPLTEVPPPRTMEWTEHAKLRELGEQLLVDLGKIRKGGGQVSKKGPF